MAVLETSEEVITEPPSHNGSDESNQPNLTESVEIPEDAETQMKEGIDTSTVGELDESPPLLSPPEARPLPDTERRYPIRQRRRPARLDEYQC